MIHSGFKSISFYSKVRKETVVHYKTLHNTSIFAHFLGILLKALSIKNFQMPTSRYRKYLSKIWKREKNEISLKHWQASEKKVLTQCQVKSEKKTISWDIMWPVKHQIVSLVIFVFMNSTLIVSGNSDHCNNRRFVKAFNSTYLQFTKETISQEYAIQNEFKNLHCCAKGYRVIEWWVTI